ncbi:hypothetical protein [Paraferrimonas sp. SM1919]|uniref:hypothetical protein n=1 Tax=Paraferrimonas sp. SM1919 TaxID=2662263 RepID=UPI0013D349D1|nr:hypothetical protein [Paraferrimonas sp. SM1919]
MSKLFNQVMVGVFAVLALACWLVIYHSLVARGYWPFAINALFVKQAIWIVAFMGISLAVVLFSMNYKKWQWYKTTLLGMVVGFCCVVIPILVEPEIKRFAVDNSVIPASMAYPKLALSECSPNSEQQSRCQYKPTQALPKYIGFWDTSDPRAKLTLINGVSHTMFPLFLLFVFAAVVAKKRSHNEETHA